MWSLSWPYVIHSYLFIMVHPSFRKRDSPFGALCAGQQRMKHLFEINPQHLILTNFFFFFFCPGLYGVDTSGDLLWSTHPSSELDRNGSYHVYLELVLRYYSVSTLRSESNTRSGKVPKRHRVRTTTVVRLHEYF